MLCDSTNVITWTKLWPVDGEKCVTFVILWQRILMCKKVTWHTYGKKYIKVWSLKIMAIKKLRIGMNANETQFLLDRDE